MQRTGSGPGCQKKFRNRVQTCLMSTRSQPQPPRPLLDPVQFEEAGRALRKWLELLRRPSVVAAETKDTSIAWEDGEPPNDTGSGLPPIR